MQTEILGRLERQNIVVTYFSIDQFAPCVVGGGFHGHITAGDLNQVRSTPG